MTRSSRLGIVGWSWLLGGVAGLCLLLGWDASPLPAALESTRLPVTRLAVPETVRVGLATDIERLSLPCCGSDLRAQAGSTQVALVEPFTVEPAARSSRGVYRLQVAALKDEAQAQHLAADLAGREGLPADVVFDAGSDLYRIRLGRFSLRDEADDRARQLAGRGVAGAFVVTEPAASLAEGLRVTQGADSWRVRGRWVVVWSRSQAGVRVEDGRYRGRLLVYLNDRGTLNLINELPLEQYLQGVVPREMGPEAYDSLEGLKAQAVAARSYAVRNLGEFKAEGYDICATPRCQVYGGMGAEHPLSDRAVAETANQILVYADEPVDAMYSSTCGGHTEDVKVVFPSKNEPYLRAVPCHEAGLTELAGDVAAVGGFPGVVVGRLLPPAETTPTPQGLAGRLRSLALEAGLALPGGTPPTLDRREVTRYVAEWLDVAMEAQLFVAGPDLPYALGEAPSAWTSDELKVATYLGRLGILDGPLQARLTRAEIESSLMALMKLLRVVEVIDGRFASANGGQLVVRVDGVARSFEVGAGLSTFRGRGDAMRSAPLALVPGDHLRVIVKDDRLVAVAQEIEPTGAAYDRSSRYSSWQRFRSDRELGKLVATRFPGVQFRSLELHDRGRSGRVGRLRLEGEDGAHIDVEGLAIRWTLDLPDTLFTAKRLEPRGGSPGWLFTGRGLGHGVGLCQVGAYGMGLRGHGYVDILTHYYSGVSLARLETVSRGEYEALGGDAG